MKLLRIILIILLSLWITIPVWPQTYRMVSYNTQSGILSDHINDVAQDHDGAIWIVTSKGLSKFDGISFQNFRDSSNLFPVSTNSRIKFVGPNEAVIAGLNLATHFIARYWKDSKWIDLQIPDSTEIGKNRIWDAALVNNELSVKYINNNVLYSYTSSRKSWTSTPLPSPTTNSYRKLVIRGRKTILLAQSGIYEETNQNWKEIFQFSESQQKSKPTDIFYDTDQDSTIWLAGTNWFCKLNDGKIIQLPIKGKEPNPKFQQIRKSSNGFLFFKSEKSFYWYHIPSHELHSFVTQSDDLDVINTRILIDKENGLWATSYRGLHHIPSFLFSGFGKEKGLMNADVSVISELSPDKYLIGLRNGYEILEDDSVISILKNSRWNVLNTRILNATKDNHNTTYLAGNQFGVGLLNSNLSIDWISLRDTAVALVSYLSDTLWAASYNGNLYYLKNKKLIKRASVKDFPRHLARLDDGRFIISTRNGVKIISGASVKTISKYSDLSIKQAFCSFIYNNKIFLGTEGGLAILENDSVKRASINGKEINRAIYSIINGKDGLWFGTDNGVYLIRDTSLTHFDENSGLMGWEINRGAFVQDSKGRLIIGTNKGLNFYDPLQTESKNLVFKPTIKWIRSVDKVFSPSNSIQLLHTENFITIGLQAISFTGKPVEFRYRMLGYQNNWQQLSSSDVREVIYRSLPPGEFIFEFQARLGNSPWSESSKTQPIHISTPLYKSYPFFFFLFLLAAAIGYSIHWVFTNKKAKDKLELEIEKSILELRKSETKLELALENSKMGVWIYSFDLDKAEYSHEMYEILDLPTLAEPLKKGNYLSFVYEGDRDRAYEDLQHALTNRTPYDIELRIILIDETLRWLHVKGKATYKNDGTPELFSGTMNNISVRKALETDRELMILELEKTNKELDRFIYSVSHDLSAPIKSIQGLINLTRMESLTADTQNYLNLIERSITRQNLFIKEIIEYGRNSRTPVQSMELDIEMLIHNILEDLKYSEYYAGTQINIQIDPQAKIIACDPVRMKIILNNLLSNALKFKSKYKEHQVSINVFKKRDSNFGLTIEDNGIGIDSKHFDKLFTMFYRATDQQPGSGIGLYIAYEAAKKMGMTLSISSTFGEGTTLTLS